LFDNIFNPAHHFFGGNQTRGLRFTQGVNNAIIT
jgi:hypothetical protein